MIFGNKVDIRFWGTNFWSLFVTSCRR